MISLPSPAACFSGLRTCLPACLPCEPAQLPEEYPCHPRHHGLGSNSCCTEASRASAAAAVAAWCSAGLFCWLLYDTGGKGTMLMLLRELGAREGKQHAAQFEQSWVYFPAKPKQASTKKASQKTQINAFFRSRLTTKAQSSQPDLAAKMAPSMRTDRYNRPAARFQRHQCPDVFNMSVGVLRFEPGHHPVGCRMQGQLYVRAHAAAMQARMAAALLHARPTSCKCAVDPALSPPCTTPHSSPGPLAPTLQRIKPPQHRNTKQHTDLQALHPTPPAPPCHALGLDAAFHCSCCSRRSATPSPSALPCWARRQVTFETAAALAMAG